MKQLVFLLCSCLLIACTDGEEASPYVDGEDLYMTSCSACHGSDGRGSNLGPDLIWDVGEQTHEGIVETILEGTGRMEPVDVSLEAADAIATYVTEEILIDW